MVELQAADNLHQGVESWNFREGKNLKFAYESFWGSCLNYCFIWFLFKLLSFACYPFGGRGITPRKQYEIDFMTYILNSC